MLMWIVYAIIFAQTAPHPQYSICEARISPELRQER